MDANSFKPMTNTSPNHKCLFKVVLQVYNKIPQEAMTCCWQLRDFRQWPFKTAFCHFCTLEASSGESWYFGLQKSLICHLPVSEIIKSKLHIVYLMCLIFWFLGFSVIEEVLGYFILTKSTNRQSESTPVQAKVLHSKPRLKYCQQNVHKGTFHPKIWWSFLIYKTNNCKAP